MLHFFNAKNKWQAGVQVTNLLALTWAAYELITNPEAKASELGMDIAIHAITFVSLYEDTNALGSFGSSSLNMFRLGAIYSGVTSGSTSVSIGLNALDAVHHLVNSATSILCSSGDEETPSSSMHSSSRM